MTHKRKADDGPRMPPHRARPPAVAQDQPAERLPVAYGLAVDLYLAAPGECSFCERQMPRISTDEGLCTACTDRRGTRDNPRSKAS